MSANQRNKGGGGGKARGKSRASASTDIEGSSDVNHSASTPCCQVARDVIVQIFPECTSHPADETKAGAKNNRDNKDDAKNKETATPHLAGEDGPDLLATLIRHHLIEERHKSQGISAGGPGKKKKKKKKKKKASQQQTPQPAGSTDASVNHDATTELKESKDVETPPSTDASSPSAVSQLPLQTSHNISTDGGATITSRPTPFDAFLDELLKKGKGAFCPPPNRNLESFVAFLRGRYEEYQRQSHTERDRVVDGGKKRRDGGGTTPQISNAVPMIRLAEAFSLCDDASCRPCQRSASAHLKSVVGGTGQSASSAAGVLPNYGGSGCFVLDSTCVETPPGLDAAPEKLAQHLTLPGDGMSCFDYVALEEGLADAKSAHDTSDGGDGTRFCLVLGATAVNDGGDEYLQLQETCSKGARPRLLSIDDIENLIACILVPGALKELEGDSAASSDGVKDAILSDEDFVSLRKAIQDQMHNTSSYFVVLNTLKGKITDLHDECIEATKTHDNFGAKASYTLRNCDQVCDEYLDNIISLLRTLTLRSIAACLEDSDVGAWIRILIQDLWDYYNDAVRPLIEPSIDYKSRVIQINNRPGSVPAMYFSAAQRREFETYVERKVSAIFTLQDRFEKRLMLPPVPSDGTNNEFMNGILKFHAISCYYSPTEEGFRLNGLLHNMTQDILLERQRLVCASIHTVDATEMLAKQKENCDTFRIMLDDFDRLYREENAMLDMDDLPRSMNDLVRNKTLQEDAISKRAQCDDKGSDESDSPDRLKVEVRNLFDTANLAIFEWRLLAMRLYHKWASCGGNRQPRLKHLPVQVTRFFGTTDDGNRDVSEDTCDGAGGRRRISCILSALLYNWLRDRCMEWHADLTQRELLATMEIDDLLVGGSESSKARSSKKKKKSKKKSGAAKIAINVPSSHDIPSDAPSNPILSESGESKSDENGGLDDQHDLADNKVQDASEATVSQREGKLKRESDPDPATVVAESVAFGTKKSPKSRTSKKETEESGSSVANIASKARTDSSQIESTVVGIVSQPTNMLPADPSPAVTPPSIDNKSDHKSARVEKSKVKSKRIEVETQVETPARSPVNVGLVDGSRFVPAESYLVKRLEAVMKTTARGRSSSGRGKAENIVLL